MEPIKNDITDYLNQIENSLKDLKEKIWSTDVLDKLMQAYDGLNRIDLSDANISFDFKSIHDVNEKVQSLCNESILSGTDDEKLLSKISEFEEHLWDVPSFLASMPNEIKLKILNELDPAELASVAIVSKEFARLVQDENLPLMKFKDDKSSTVLVEAFKTEFTTLDRNEFKTKYANELHHVKGLDLREVEVSDELLQFIKDSCPHIRSLSLPKSINDAGLASFPKGLASLDLAWCTQITDAGLASLPKSLTSLNLTWCTQITDAGLASLPKGLASLNLRGCTQITDTGLASLPKSLTSLNLRGCDKITDAELKSLPKGLASLDLAWCTQITDAGLKSLPKGLASLDLAGCTQITDTGLASLPKGLASLNLAKCTQITDAGILFLKNRNPNIEIVR